LRSGLGGDAIGSTVEARVGVVDDDHIVDYRFIDVGVMYYGGVDVHDSRIVGESSASPFTAGEANPTESEPVVDASIKAYLSAPIARVKNVYTPVAPTPISRRPKITGSRGEHPRTGNPIVVPIIGAPGPIAR